MIRRGATRHQMLFDLNENCIFVYFEEQVYVTLDDISKRGFGGFYLLKDVLSDKQFGIARMITTDEKDLVLFPKNNMSLIMSYL